MVVNPDTVTPMPTVMLVQSTAAATSLTLPTAQLTTAPTLAASLESPSEVFLEQKGYQLLSGPNCNLNNVDPCVKYPVTEITAKGNAVTMMYAQNQTMYQKLIGKFTGNVFSGDVVVEDTVQGSFTLTFDASFLTATGEWKKLNGERASLFINRRT